MARRDTPKREAKKPKKKNEKRIEVPEVYSAAEVAVVGKRRKPKEDE